MSRKINIIHLGINNYIMSIYNCQGFFLRFFILVPQTCVLILFDSAQFRLFYEGSWVQRFTEWALKYHFAAASLCANIESKVQGKTLQSGLILYFYSKRNFSPVSATGLAFLLCSETFYYAIKLSAVQQNFLLCSKTFCYILKPFVVQQNFLLCNKTFCCALKLSIMQ